MTVTALDGLPHYDAVPTRPLIVAASRATETAIGALGRVEDIRFSPSNQRLAIAAYTLNACLIVEVAIDRQGGRPGIRLGRSLTLYSPVLRAPHGLEWLGEDRLIVASRSGNVDIFAVPPFGGDHEARQCTPAYSITQSGRGRKLITPGSVCARRVSRRRIDLFVCHTFGNQLSQHLLYSFAGRWIGRHRRALERGLNVPDGIAISADGRWLAISNHRTHSVLMFDASRRLSANTRKLGELLGAGYPHGIRFSPDGRTLYVADAGAPVVRQYHAEAGDWHGTRESSGVARILDEQTFLAGRYNPEEGGPKGIDIDAIASVMVASSEMQPLAFFAMEDLFADTRSAAQETGRVLPAHIPAA